MAKLSRYWAFGNPNGQDTHQIRDGAHPSLARDDHEHDRVADDRQAEDGEEENDEHDVARRRVEGAQDGRLRRGGRHGRRRRVVHPLVLPAAFTDRHRRRDAIQLATARVVHWL